MKRSVCVCRFVVAISMVYSWQISAAELPETADASCVYSGRFEQNKFLKGLDDPVQSTGAFFYHCEQGVIWKTLTPIEEALILSKTGTNYKVTEGEPISLTSKQSGTLSQLMNGLIGLDSAYLGEQFSISLLELSSNNEALTNNSTSANAIESAINNTRNRYLLIPKKRKVKKALLRIELVLVGLDQSSLDESSPSKSATISMLDRKKQWTHIESIILNEYADQPLAIDHCRNLNLFANHECEFLLSPPSG